MTYLLEAPEIVESPEQLVAMIPLVVARAQMPEVMGPGIGEVFAVISAQNIGVAGPWFAHHYRITDEQFDFAICVPVSSAVSATGRVVPGVRRAATVARAVLCGPYEHLGDGWGELMTWIDESAHRAESDLWEVYLSGPESSSDSTMWRTQLNRPLMVQ
jgi:effector-binding domain-containing protein